MVDENGRNHDIRKSGGIVKERKVVVMNLV